MHTNLLSHGAFGWPLPLHTCIRICVDARIHTHMTQIRTALEPLSQLGQLRLNNNRVQSSSNSERPGNLGQYLNPSERNS